MGPRMKWMLATGGSLLLFFGNLVVGLAFHLPGWITSPAMLAFAGMTLWCGYKLQRVLEEE